MADSPDSLKDVTVEDHLRYMIDVYKSFLVQHLDCVELLPYMSFLRESAARIRKLKRNGQLVESATLFFESLEASDDEGRYASFRDALGEAEQEIVKTVLEGGSINDYHDENRKLIDIFCKPISEKLDPIVMMQHLRSKNILTERDESEIRHISRDCSRFEAVLMLLHCVFRRKIEWYNEFMAVMYVMNPDLVEMVDPEFVEKHLAHQSISEKQFEEDVDMGTIVEETMEGIACGQKQEASPSNITRISRDQKKEAVDRLKHYHGNSEPTNQKSRMSHAIDSQSPRCPPVNNLSSESHQTPKLPGNSFKGNTRTCDQVDCVHCALRNDEVQSLRSQLSDMQDELSDLKKIVNRFLHPK